MERLTEEYMKGMGDEESPLYVPAYAKWTLDGDNNDDDDNGDKPANKRKKPKKGTGSRKKPKKNTEEEGGGGDGNDEEDDGEEDDDDDGDADDDNSTSLGNLLKNLGKQLVALYENFVSASLLDRQTIIGLEVTNVKLGGS